jgi:hypothetical protein
MCNAAGDVERLEFAAEYILACQIDGNCVVEGAEHEEEEHSDEPTESLWRLKVGLAFAFMAITIVSAFVPVLFQGLSKYAVCSSQLRRTL